MREPSAVVEHEASTSKIGEDQLFYFQQRGVEAEAAVGMIISGFCREVGGVGAGSRGCAGAAPPALARATAAASVERAWLPRTISRSRGDQPLCLAPPCDKPLPHP